MSAPRGQQRDRVLTLLREADAPLDAHALADALDIHLTTVRFHLTSLIEGGQVRIRRQASRSVGRPRFEYEVIPTMSYAAVVGLIAVRLGGTAQAREAKAREIGADLAKELESSAPVPTSDVGLLIAETLVQLGFEIKSVVNSFGNYTVKVCTCALVEIAKRSPEVVRGIQQGLIQSVVDRHYSELGRRYVVTANPDPAGGNCEVEVAIQPAGTGGGVAPLSATFATTTTHRSP